MMPIEQQDKHIRHLKMLIKELLPLAETGLQYMIDKGSSHQEFISEDKEWIRKAKNIIEP